MHVLFQYDKSVENAGNPATNRITRLLPLGRAQWQAAAEGGPSFLWNGPMKGPGEPSSSVVKQLRILMDM